MRLYRVCVHKVGKLKRDVHLDFSFNHLWLYETYACDADRRVWGWPQEGSALIEVCFTTEVTSRPLQGTSLKTLIENIQIHDGVNIIS